MKVISHIPVVVLRNGTYAQATLSPQPEHFSILPFILPMIAVGIAAFCLLYGSLWILNKTVTRDGK